MIFAKTAMHSGVNLRPRMERAATAGALLNQPQYLGGTGFSKITFYNVIGVQVYHRASRSSEM
jgi:hypothetical protein